MAVKQEESVMELVHSPARVTRAGGARVEGQYRLGEADELDDSELQLDSSESKGKARRAPKVKQEEDEEFMDDRKSGGKATSSTSPKKGGKAVQKGPGRSKAGRLTSIVRLPTEVICSTFALLEPKDLLNLCVTAKVFAHALMCRSAVTIWQAAFWSIGIDTSTVVSDRNLQKWAHLVLIRKCQLCTAVCHSADYTASTRLCKVCVKRTVFTESRILKDLKQGKITRGSVYEMRNPVKVANNSKNSKKKAALAIEAAQPSTSSSSALDDTPISIFAPTWQAVPRVSIDSDGGAHSHARAHKIYLPDLVELSDKLLVLHQDDICQFGEEVIKAPFAKGTRVMAYIEKQREQEPLLAQDSKMFNLWTCLMRGANRR